MLNLYTDKKMLNQANRKQIFPLLLDIFFVPNQEVLNHFRLVDTIQEADIALLPLHVEYHLLHHKYGYVKQFIAKAKTHKKTVWVYSGGDFGYTLKENVVHFKANAFKSRDAKNAIIMPSFISEPYQSYNLKAFQSIAKTIKPKIGFVGHADTGWLKLVKEYWAYAKHYIKKYIKKAYVDFQPFYPSSVKRYHFLKQLKASNHLETDFIFRKKYRAGVKNNLEKQKTTLEFYTNIYNNPYTFCMRGTGNFSVRFYETLAMGRIPILMDTDVMLPLENIINWEKHCVIVKSIEAKQLARKIMAFHNNLTDAEFQDLQKENRALWFDKLNRHTFFIQLHNQYKASKKNALTLEIN